MQKATFPQKLRLKNYNILVCTLFLSIACLPFTQCTQQSTPGKKDKTAEIKTLPPAATKVELTLSEANRLATLPLACIQNPLPYKSGIVIASEKDLQMPIVHHPAFYGCFDWHSAVHGHWSLVYLMKTFPDLEGSQEARKRLNENLTAENIKTELAYFSLNGQTKSFERTYGWAWLLKLAEELYTWDDPDAKKWYTNLKPLTEHIAAAYITYLPKLVYPIRVGEHSNTAFGLSFALDYAQACGDAPLLESLKENALRFYSDDQGCPIAWEPSGYDFLSPCLQELDIMRKILDDAAFNNWSRAFLPGLFNATIELEPATILDRSDGKLVHLDGLNFSRAWCLYSLDECDSCIKIADDHLAFSLANITDGDYAGQHWLASFALYAFKAARE